eukprot:363354-Chlamydomonas_euryale.AAC.11
MSVGASAHADTYLRGHAQARKALRRHGGSHPATQPRGPAGLPRARVSFLPAQQLRLRLGAHVCARPCMHYVEFACMHVFAPVLCVILAMHGRMEPFMR